jgi:ribosomal protein S18 acetylase RimI-like enzyme
MLREPDDEELKILPSKETELPAINYLFEESIKSYSRKGFRVWEFIDKSRLEKDITQGLQYKIQRGNEILCVFSIQYSDPFIWRERDKDTAIYLHRIVVNPNFRGMRLFEKVLNWAKRHATENRINYIRMDTWADNKKIIDYYLGYGFMFIENFTTSDTMELPEQNRNLRVALLELKLKNDSEDSLQSV